MNQKSAKKFINFFSRLIIIHSDKLFLEGHAMNCACNARLPIFSIEKRIDLYERIRRLHRQKSC